MNTIQLSKTLNAENYENKERSAIGEHRLGVLELLCLEKKQLDGEMCEVGVWRGGVGILMGECTADTQTRITLFDTFEGIPYHNEKDNFHRVGDFGKGDAVTSYDEVCETLSRYKNISVYKGIFPQDTGDVIRNSKFSFVHLDVDVYQSYKECLEFFVPKMVKGGIILLDDYAIDTCEGATLACDEFVAANNLKIDWTWGHPYIQL